MPCSPRRPEITSPVSPESVARSKESSLMRKLAVALVASLLMACAQLASLNPFGGGGGGPAEMFAIAKAAYVGAFRSAATYVTLCQSQPPTESCDKFTVRLYDEVNPRARE